MKKCSTCRNTNICSVYKQIVSHINSINIEVNNCNYYINSINSNDNISTNTKPTRQPKMFYPDLKEIIPQKEEEKTSTVKVFDNITVSDCDEMYACSICQQECKFEELNVCSSCNKFVCRNCLKDGKCFDCYERPVVTETLQKTETLDDILEEMKNNIVDNSTKETEQE